MLPLKVSATAFLADLTAAKSTSMAAAVVLGFTVVPLSGGGIKPYEVRELRAAIFGGVNEDAPRTIATADPVTTDVIVDVRRAEARVVRVSATTENDVPEAQTELPGGEIESLALVEPPEEIAALEIPQLDETQTMELPEVAEPEFEELSAG